MIKLKKCMFVKTLKNIKVDEEIMPTGTIGCVLKAGKSQTINFNFYKNNEYMYKEKVILSSDFSNLVEETTKQSEDFLQHFSTKKEKMMETGRGVTYSAELYFDDDHIATIADRGDGGALSYYPTMKENGLLKEAISYCKETLLQQYIVDPELQKAVKRNYKKFIEMNSEIADQDEKEFAFSDVSEHTLNYLSERHNQTESFVSYFINFVLD